MKRKLVVLTGAGMSAESGIATFRDSGGLWEQYPVEQVATPEGFDADPELVLNFYNMRRRELLKAKPNDGHKGLHRHLHECLSRGRLTQRRQKKCAGLADRSQRCLYHAIQHTPHKKTEHRKESKS